jgi:hypothetical protein
MRRVAIGLLLAVLLLMPSPASAKIPWSSVEMEPAAPVAGDPFTVTVRFWNDAALSRPSAWSPMSEGDHGASLEFDGPAGRVPLVLTPIGNGAFRAEVSLAAGTWRLLAIQSFSGATGPTDIELATVTVAAAPNATAPIGAAVIAVALGAVGIIWRGRRPSLLTERA